MTKGAYPEDRVGALWTEVKLPPAYRIFPTRHAKTPLGTAPADSRPCGTESGFTVLYVTPDFATAFIELVVRDRLTRANDREILLKEVTTRSQARIISKPRTRLSILDLRGDGCTRLGAPTGAVNAHNHADGRALGRDVHDNHSRVDGILFSSRLTNADVYAIFGRAIPKLKSEAARPLDRHSELPDVLRHHDIKLIVRR